MTHTSWRLVILESPYAGDVALNERYARACMADCLSRGEAPFASHLLYTQPGVLDDNVPEERAKGIAAGHAWMRAADAVVLYRDIAMSKGMAAGLALAQELRLPVETRYLPAERFLQFLREHKQAIEATVPQE